MLKTLVSLEQSLNRVSENIGNIISWLVPILIIIIFFTVILRYIFDQNLIWLQDTVTYIHASILMLCIGYTEYCEKHVRVDIFYRKASLKQRYLIDLIGHIVLLIPTSTTLLILGSQYALRSWLLLEKSLEVGGLPLVFILKSLIPLMALFLLTQSIAGAIRSIRYLLAKQ